MIGDRRPYGKRDSAESAAMRAPFGVLMAGSLACIMFLSACGSGQYEPGTPVVYTTQPAVPTAAVPAAGGAQTTSAPPATPTNVFVATSTGTNGNSGRVTLRVGSAISPAKAPGVTGGSVAEASCLTAVNNEHDLVIPFELELTNLNASLSLPPNFAVGYVFVFTGQSLPLDEGVSSVEFFSGGPKCTEVDNSMMNGNRMLVSLRLGADLAAGSTVAVAGYLLLSAVVQPNFPTGDPGMLRHAFLTPQQEEGGPTVTIGSGSWRPINPPIGQITTGIPLAL